MRSYRTLKTPLKQQSKRVFRTAPATTRKMSFFPGSFLTSSSPSSHDTSFHPLFRFLDDFEQHRGNNTTTTDPRNRTHTRQIMKSFTPKFDVKELEDAYELHGDLPGIEQKDIEIEFTDIQTITVKGRTERSYTSGSPPAIEDATKQRSIEHPGGKAHKATVEDSDEDTTGAAEKSTEVTTTNNNTTTDSKNEQVAVPEAKYWVSERSVGEFSRSFTFPVRVDQDAVKASMKNGVLSIVVPKARKHEARKIPIWSSGQ